MKYFFTISFFLWTILSISELKSQCTPPSADNCDLAHVLCSLNEVHGYCCSNTDYSNPTGCTPLCPSGGAPHNTGWWAFVTQGGAVSINISIDDCSVNGSGVQLGIWGDCSCSESIVCNPGCNNSGSFTLSGNLAACKTYYLFVDGCNGDVCDFCLSTSGGGPPSLPPLQPTHGPRDVCVGACNIRYSVNVGGTCEPTYEWTLDGSEMGSGTGEISIDFPDEGDFVLCVAAYIGNPQSGSICDQEGPQCLTIRVRPIPDKIGPPWTLCYEYTPFKWHGNIISSSGVYRQQFSDGATCCKFDSVRNFIILEVPEYPVVYYLGCIGDSYIDPTTRTTYSTCQYDKVIMQDKSTSPWKCDSAYRLNAVFLDYQAQFRINCDSGEVILESRPIDRTRTCGNLTPIDQTYSYRWYRYEDSLRTTLDTQYYFKPDSASRYCLELSVKASFGTAKSDCVFHFCEDLNENDYFPAKFCSSGDLDTSPDKISNYFIDSLPARPDSQYWKVSGGQILDSHQGRDTHRIQVQWDSSGFREVCYRYYNSCGYSPWCCTEIKFSSGVKTTSWQNQISIIPNPAKDQFSIEIPASMKCLNWEMLDAKGGKILSYKHSSELKNISIAGRAPGVYYIIIYTVKGSCIKRLVII